MAIVAPNPLINGLSGMLGKTIVFKTLRGKTIMANRPSRPQKQSEQQRTNRSRFREATAFAKVAMLDEKKKEYYRKKAKKLKLPNAYTAAITDYMRKPKMTMSDNSDSAVTCCVTKKDFTLKKVEVVIHKAEGKEVRTIIPRSDEWCFKLQKKEIIKENYVRVTNEAGKETVIMLRDWV